MLAVCRLHAAGCVDFSHDRRKSAVETVNEIIAELIVYSDFRTGQIGEYRIVGIAYHLIGSVSIGPRHIKSGTRGIKIIFRSRLSIMVHTQATYLMRSVIRSVFSVYVPAVSLKLALDGILHRLLFVLAVAVNNITTENGIVFVGIINNRVIVETVFGKSNKVVNRDGSLVE